MLGKWRLENKESKIFALPMPQVNPSEEGVEQILTEAQIERYELPLNMARMLTYLLCTMFLIFLVWAAVAPIDVVAKAPGQLRPYGKPKLIQSELSGKVQRIAVREGTHVKQNDVLVELDATVYQDQLNQRILSVQQEKIKLEQLTQGKDVLEAVIKNPSVLPVIVNDIGNVSQVVNDVYLSQKTLAEARYDAASGKQKDGASPGEIQSLKDMLVQAELERSQREKQVALLRGQYQTEEQQKKAKTASLKQQLASHKQMLDELKQVLSVSREQENDYAKALDLGVSQVQFLDIKQKVGESNRRVLDETATISNLQSEFDQAVLELPRWRIQSQGELLSAENEVNNVVGKIRDTEIKLRSSSKVLEQAQAQADAAIERAKAALSGQTDRLAMQQKAVKEHEQAAQETRHLVGRANVTAPMAGTVTRLTIRAAGEMVTFGEQLMRIVPDHSDLLVEATVKNSDIGFVHLGQDVKLKLDAFPYQDFGVLRGTVSEIEQYPEPDKAAGWVYMVRIQPKEMEITTRGGKIPLKDGLTAECDIILRKVTVLQALMRPLARFNNMTVKT